MSSSYKWLAENILTEMPRRLGDRPDSQAFKKKKRERELIQKQADALNVKHMGGGYYGKDDQTGVTHKIDGERLIPISPEEKQSIQQPQTKQPDTPKQSTTQEPSGDAEAPTNVLDPSAGAVKFTKAQFSNLLSDRQVKMTRYIRSNPKLASVADESIRDYTKFYAELDTINKLPAGERKRNRMEKFISDWSLLVGANKIYANKFSRTAGLYKPFGNQFGEDANLLIQIFDSEGVSIPSISSNLGLVKSHLSAKSKPDLGRPHKYDDPKVSNIFDDPAFDGIAPQYRSLFGPTDKDGTLLRSGGVNAKMYFDHSVKSKKNIDTTIKSLEAIAKDVGESIDSDVGFTGVAKALKTYQEKMEMMNEIFDIMQPQQRSAAVGKIYAELATSMYTANSDVASSIMKNISELALYDTEIAAGDEAYLPAQGTFPVGDKIVIKRNETKIERIDTISVKFGRNSYGGVGMPGEAGKFCLYHPNKKFHDLLDNRAGRNGYETGVKGDVIHDASEFRDIARTSGFQQCFDDETLEKIRSIGVEMTLATRNFKRSHPQATNGKLSSRYMNGFEAQPEMKMLGAKLFNTLLNGDQDKLRNFLGDANYNHLMKPHRCMSIYSMMVFGAALQTSGGFSNILHNHQEYKDGQFISQTKTGTQNIKDWQLTWIPYGDRAGGLKAGFK